MPQREFEVYNLQFPEYINDLIIDGYAFSRIEEYKEAFSGLSHFINSTGGEFPINQNEGQNVITAKVRFPKETRKVVLPWQNKKANRIHDILLVLSIFTGRNVFIKDWIGNQVIVVDPRIYGWGNQLRLSIGGYEGFFKNKETGQIINFNEEVEKGIDRYKFVPVNIKFEKDINNILLLISSKKWQEKYKGGYFLFLFKDMSQYQNIEKSFLLCWTIWEHIFSLDNIQWLSEIDIYKMSSDRKIAFVLNKYFNKVISAKNSKRIKVLSDNRNKLVHFGTRSLKIEDMRNFIWLTDQLMAKILELSIDNSLNSLEWLDSFLNI